jgi:hypothetical protein
VTDPLNHSRASPTSGQLHRVGDARRPLSAMSMVLPLGGRRVSDRLIPDEISLGDVFDRMMADRLAVVTSDLMHCALATVQRSISRNT